MDALNAEIQLRSSVRSGTSEFSGVWEAEQVADSFTDGIICQQGTGFKGKGDGRIGIEDAAADSVAVLYREICHNFTRPRRELTSLAVHQDVRILPLSTPRSR